MNDGEVKEKSKIAEVVIYECYTLSDVNKRMINLLPLLYYYSK